MKERKKRVLLQNVILLHRGRLFGEKCFCFFRVLAEWLEKKYILKRRMTILDQKIYIASLKFYEAVPLVKFPVMN